MTNRKTKFIQLLLIATSFFMTINSNADPQKEFFDLVNEEKFQQAQQFLNDNIYLSGHRTGLNNTIKCVPSLKRCDSIPTEQIALRQCFVEMTSKCGSFLIGKWQSLKDLKYKTLLDAWETSEKQRTSFCDDGLKWGYVREKKLKCETCTIGSDKIPLKKLTGEFDTKNECEEQRILDSKWMTSLQCFSRYVKEQKKLNLFKIKILIQKSNMPTNFDLFFKGQQRCLAVLREGLNYFNPQLKHYQISPSGTTDDIRFIGNCEQASVIACKKFEQGTVFHGDIVD